MPVSKEFLKEGSMRTQIRNVRVIDGNGSVLENANILFDESGILDISKDELPAESVIDGTGSSVLPGLIDSHVHLGIGALGESVPDEVQGAAMVNQFRTFLQYGVTTVRNMSTAHDCDIKMRDLLKTGYLKGPRVMACGRGISITGGHGWMNNYEADTPEEAVKAARKVIYHDADHIKMFATGGMGTKGSIPNAPQLSEEQMRAIVREAERVGLPTAAHCTGIEGAQRAIRAGVRSIEHIQMDETTAKMMKEYGCYYCPTIVTRYNIIHSTEPEYEFMRRKASPKDLERKEKAIRYCLEYHIPICTGTDSIGTVKNDGLTRMGESIHTEMEIYHEYGMTNMQVIESTTRIPAEMMKIDDLTGTLDKGKCADLILVEGNPLDDLRVLRKLLLTVRGGEILYRRGC